MPVKTIIDTDSGIDDAMAIAFAYYSPAIDLIGLTTVFGNVSVEQATTNALTLLDRLGAPLPVAKGAAYPLIKNLVNYPDFVHGKNGFGDIPFKPSQRRPVVESASEFLIEQVMSDPGNVTIVAIGPLTNLALAAQKEPEFLEMAGQIVIMGGAISVNGNVNPAAEANMLSDPHAADFLLSQPGPLVVVGLDVTHQVVMSDNFLKEVHQSSDSVGKWLYLMSRFYLNFHRSMGVDGLFTHDPSAIAYVIEPELYTVKYGEIRVLTEGIAIGQTIMNLNDRLLGETAWNGIPKHGVCLEVNSQRLLELYKATFLGK